MSDEWRYVPFNDEIAVEQQQVCPTCGKVLHDPNMDDVEASVRDRLHMVIEHLEHLAIDDPTNFLIKLRKYGGVSLRDSAKELGFRSHVSVLKRLKSMNCHKGVTKKGHGVAYEMKRRRITHRQLARKLGMSREAVSKAAARGIKTMRTAIRYANAIGCAPQDIITP